MTAVKALEATSVRPRVGDQEWQARVELAARLPAGRPAWVDETWSTVAFR